MKTKILFLFLISIFISCKNKHLKDSFIYFDEAQPRDVKSVGSFSSKYIGTFGSDYLHRLRVESNCIIEIEINRYDATKSQIDSLPDIEFKNNIVYDKLTHEAYRTFVENDTVKWEIESLDTLFSFAENETAKIYKSNLILNTKVDGKYLVNIIKFEFACNKYLQLGTRKDFKKIKNLLKIPFEVNIENNDTAFIMLKPSRSDFRKLLRVDGFEYEKFYYFK